MGVTSEQAAALCDCKAHYFARFANTIGLRPDRRFIPGLVARRFVWGVRHVLAVKLVPTLDRIGVPAVAAAEFVRGLVEAYPTDEAFEAALTDRPLIMIVGGQVCPFTVDHATLKEADQTRGELLKRMGLRLRGVDLSVMWHQLVEAARRIQDAAKGASTI